MSDLVGTTLYRFSHDAAHLSTRRFNADVSDIFC